MKILYVLLCGTLLGFGLGLEWQLGEPVVNESLTTEWQMWDANTMPIPTIEQIQQAVGSRVDGKIGKETLEKWDRAVCDLYASRWNYMYEGK